MMAGGIVRDVETALNHAAHWLQSAFGQLGNDVSRVGSLAVTLIDDLWGHSGYAVINLAALVISTGLLSIATLTSLSPGWKTHGVARFLGLDFLTAGLVGASLVLVENAHGIWSHGLGFAFLGAELVGLFTLLTYQLYRLDSIEDDGGTPGSRRAPDDSKGVSTGPPAIESIDTTAEFGEEITEPGLYLDEPWVQPAVPLARESTPSG